MTRARDLADYVATGVTSSELDILDGLTATVSELNIMDGVTSTTAELNILDGVTSTAAELNILDGVTSTATELNLLDGVTATTAELNILDGVTATAAELNTLDGVTAVVGELNALDLGSTAVGNAIASKAVILDSNKDYTGLRNVTATGAITGGSFVIGSADINENDLESIDGITAGTIAASKAAVVDSNKDVTGFRNITLTGELDAATLDISGDADIDGTTNLDVVDIDGAVDMASTLAVGGVLTASAGIDLNGTELILDADADTSITADSDDVIDFRAGGTDIVSMGGANSGMDIKSSLGLRVVNGSETMYSAVCGNDGATTFLTNRTDGTSAHGSYIFNTRDGGSTLTRMTVNASGNVVVNNTLDAAVVDGENFKVNGAQGSDGQVLTSTGSGVGWEAIPSSGGMTLLSTATISNTTTQNFSMTNIFSGTYQNYFFISDGAGLVSSDADIRVYVIDGSGIKSSGGYVGKMQNTVGNATYSGWATSSTSGALLMMLLRAPDADQLGGGFKGYVNFNTSNTTKINAMAEYFRDAGGNLFTSGGLVAESNTDSSAYSGTPSGLNFATDSGSKYFANGMKVRIYGLTAS